jgi:hypothetical protein
MVSSHQSINVVLGHNAGVNSVEFFICIKREDCGFAFGG